MKISTMIKQLQELAEKLGDVEVCVYDEYHECIQPIYKNGLEEYDDEGEIIVRIQ